VGTRTSGSVGGRGSGPAATLLPRPGVSNLERVNRKIKRGTDVVGVFRNPVALLRLAGDVLVEAHDEWQVSDRRYLSESSMSLLTARTQDCGHPRAHDGMISTMTRAW
jgi:Transposase, Mutator family